MKIYADRSAAESTSITARTKAKMKKTDKEEDVCKPVPIDIAYEQLANAIVELAVKDYRKKGDDPIIENFFRSRWFAQLTKVDPDFLLSQLRAEEAD